MKYAKLLAFVLCFGLLLAGQSMAGQKAGDLAAEIKSAAYLLLSGPPEKEVAQKSLVSLVEAISRIAADDKRLSADFGTKMRKASASLKANAFGDDARLGLNEAYKLLNSGKSFSMPANIKSMGEASGVARRKIDHGLEALKSGRSDQAAQDILEFVLLVITPVEQSL